MIGGIVSLGIIGIASEMLTKYGLAAVLIASYPERKRKGESIKKLLREIIELSILGDLRRKLRDAIA